MGLNWKLHKFNFLLKISRKKLAVLAQGLLFFVFYTFCEFVVIRLAKNGRNEIAIGRILRELNFLLERFRKAIIRILLN